MRRSGCTILGRFLGIQFPNVIFTPRADLFKQASERSGSTWQAGLRAAQWPPPAAASVGRDV
jgi:hypothetical protein